MSLQYLQSLRSVPQFRPQRPLTDSRGQPLEQAITSAKLQKVLPQNRLNESPNKRRVLSQLTPLGENESCSCAQVKKTNVLSVYINTHTPLSMQAVVPGITATVQSN